MGGVGAGLGFWLCHSGHPLLLGILLVVPKPSIPPPVMVKSWIFLLGIAAALGSISSNLEGSWESCEGPCEEERGAGGVPCHCHPECHRYRNCCRDYAHHCHHGRGWSEEEEEEEGVGGHGSFSRSHDSITDQDLLRISEQLYQADENRAQLGDLTINPQYQAAPGELGHQLDHCPQPLYKYVNEELFSKPTYSSFIRLLDNFQRSTGKEEEVTEEELREQEEFLREVMETKVMEKLFTFLQQKNRYDSQEEFYSDLKEMWFGIYSRGDGQRDSSGFEHIFSGEVKKGKVSGFHNWIRFYLLEKEGTLNYLSHNFDGPWDTYPDVLGLQFSWDGFHKELGSAFIGSSPEFELGIYTLCFISRPGRQCHLSLGGHSLSIQTYPWTKSSYGTGKKFIATAYVVSP